MNVNLGRIPEVAYLYPSGDRDGEGCAMERRRRQSQQGAISTSEYVCAYRVILLTRSLLVAKAIVLKDTPICRTQRIDERKRNSRIEIIGERERKASRIRYFEL